MSFSFLFLNRFHQSTLDIAILYTFFFCLTKKTNQSIGLEIIFFRSIQMMRNQGEKGRQTSLIISHRIITTIPSESIRYSIADYH